MTDERHDLPPRDRVASLVGAAVVLVMLAVYGLSNPYRTNAYDHFVWQAWAWLEGQAAIRYPVHAERPGQPEDWYYVDVQPVLDASGAATGRGLLPYPPLPALVLLPFVAAWGLATDQQLIGTILGALDVGLAFWVLGRLPVRPLVRLAATVFFGLGTVFWYTAMESTTWFFAHVVAVGLTFAAVAVALDGDPAAVAWSAVDDWEPGPEAPGPPAGPFARWGLSPRHVLAGALLGLAATARLTVAFGLPFLVLVGAGGSWPRRAASAVLGMAVPLAAFVGYNLATTGHLFTPVYESVWRTEIAFYPNLPQFSYLQYHLDWGIEDPRYIPQNLVLALVNPPLLAPPCQAPELARRLFDPACTWLVPRADTMGLLWTSPAWLLALPVLRSWGKGRLVSGALLASGAIFVVNLMHFSQGWVQFGYRFSDDFAPFLLPCLALGLERLGGVRWWAAGLIGASIVVNWWGVVWGTTLRW